MNVYRPDTPRAAFALAAAAMTGITMALMVVLPAVLEDAGAADYTVEAKAERAAVQAAVVHRGLNVGYTVDCEEQGVSARIARGDMPQSCVPRRTLPVDTPDRS